MSMNLKSARRTAALLLVGIALTGCAGLATSPSAAIQQQIEAARTPADHEALATYYVKEAAWARGRAEDHRKMATSYLASPGGRGVASMPAHCRAQVASFEDIAKKYDEMAAEHRQFAAQAKP